MSLIPAKQLEFMQRCMGCNSLKRGGFCGIKKDDSIGSARKRIESPITSISTCPIGRGTINLVFGDNTDDFA